jgi:chemotaxis protein MotB
MSDDKKDQPIIIVKKGEKHQGHHSGAWKVAYADFVTAMMAFFLVMWIVVQSDQIKEAVQLYFQDPINFTQRYQRYRSNILQRGAGVLKYGSTDDAPETASSVEEEIKKEMAGLAARLRQAIDDMPGLDVLRKHVEIEITQEGLRIQLIEGSENVSFFRPGSPILSIKGELILKTIAMELSKLPNQLVIEGHTDASDLAVGEHYTNWELSTDRANAARRAMAEGKLKPGQIYHVRGYAANKPRIKEDRYDPRNRRITILVLSRLMGKPEPGDDYQTPIIMSQGD